MVVVKKFVNGYEVIDSGTIHVAGDSLQLVLDGMPIDILFKDDGGNARFITEVDGLSLKISLFNFNNPLGEGRIEPIGVATSQGRDIKLTFFSHTIDKAKSERVFSYTFLMGPQVNG